MSGRSWFVPAVGSIVQIGGHVLGDIHHDSHAQTFQNLKELALMDRFATAFDLAQEILTDADTASGIVLANSLYLTAGAHHCVDGCCVINRVFLNESSRLRGFFAKWGRLAINPFDRVDFMCCSFREQFNVGLITIAAILFLACHLCHYA